MEQDIGDGLDALRKELSIGEIMRLIERTTKWVSRDTFNLLPVWYPEYARKSSFYKENWSKPQMNKNRQTGNSTQKFEGNTHANKALTNALGLRSKERPNWTCCHLWGVDDPSYQQHNAIVQDRRYFSCVANMVLMPTPLKAFTDVMPDVKTMMRVCAANLYGWMCEHEAATETNKDIVSFNRWADYPESWPKKKNENTPLGIINLNGRIEKSISRRLAQINKDLEKAGTNYPRKEVEETLVYWNVSLQGETK